MAKGIRRLDVASMAGVSLEAVDRLEHGKVLGMKVSTLLEIAKGLGVRVSDLLPAFDVKWSNGKGQPNEALDTQ